MYSDDWLISQIYSGTILLLIALKQNDLCSKYSRFYYDVCKMILLYITVKKVQRRVIKFPGKSLSNIYIFSSSNS